MTIRFRLKMSEERINSGIELSTGLISGNLEGEYFTGHAATMIDFDWWCEVTGFIPADQVDKAVAFTEGVLCGMQDRFSDGADQVFAFYKLVDRIETCEYIADRALFGGVDKFAQKYLTSKPGFYRRPVAVRDIYEEKTKDQIDYLIRFNRVELDAIKDKLKEDLFKDEKLSIAAKLAKFVTTKKKLLEDRKKVFAGKQMDYVMINGNKMIDDALSAMIDEAEALIIQMLPELPTTGNTLAYTLKLKVDRNISFMFMKLVQIRTSFNDLNGNDDPIYYDQLADDLTTFIQQCKDKVSDDNVRPNFFTEALAFIKDKEVVKEIVEYGIKSYNEKLEEAEQLLNDIKAEL